MSISTTRALAQQRRLCCWPVAAMVPMADCRSARYYDDRHYDGGDSWYDDYYYPGTGYYVYDRNRKARRWSRGSSVTGSHAVPPCETSAASATTGIAGNAERRDATAVSIAGTGVTIAATVHEPSAAPTGVQRPDAKPAARPPVVERGRKPVAKRVRTAAERLAVKPCANAVGTHAARHVGIGAGTLAAKTCANGAGMRGARRVGIGVAMHGATVGATAAGTVVTAAVNRTTDRGPQVLIA